MTAPIWHSSAYLIVVSSPSGTRAVVKQYDPLGDGPLNVLLRKRENAIQRSTPILSVQDLPASWGDEGITIGWIDEHHVMIGWPQGAKPIAGPNRVDDVDIDYVSYLADITHRQATAGRDMELHDVSVSFEEIDGSNGKVRHSHSNEANPLIDCTVSITGRDGLVFDRVTAQVIGHGIGHAADSPHAHSYGGIGIKVSLTSLPDGISPALTPTQAEIGNVFPVNDLTSAPEQADHSLSYKSFTISEAEAIFSTIRSKNLRLISDFRVAFVSV